MNMLELAHSVQVAKLSPNANEEFFQYLKHPKSIPCFIDGFTLGMKSKSIVLFLSGN